MLRTLAFLGIAVFVGKSLLNRAGGSKDAPETDRPNGPGHSPTDLSGDTHPDGSERADDHFRPDPHAEVAPDDKEGLRPVTFKPSTGPTGV